MLNDYMHSQQCGVEIYIHYTTYSAVAGKADWNTAVSTNGWRTRQFKEALINSGPDGACRTLDDSTAVAGNLPIFPIFFVK